MAVIEDATVDEVITIASEVNIENIPKPTEQETLNI